MEVQLYVYDLSRGLARQMSMQLLGVQIDAIYHTSLVFNGVEYLFGQGIHTAYPGGTHHGRPMEIIPLGDTSLPEDVIQEYLQSLEDVYTAASYDLFTHNCNNFTNDLAMFLLGRGIPDHIASLPKRVLDTPFGQMLRPQIDTAMRPITQAPISSPSTSRSLPNQQKDTKSSNGVSSSKSVASSSKVHIVSSDAELKSVLDQAKDSCAVVFFTSQSCGPCKMLYPVYDELATEYAGRASFVKVDVSHALDIASKYSINATPTFSTFLKGQMEETWSGADVSRLRANVRLIIQAAFPPHPHRLLKLPKFLRQSMKAVAYAKVPPLEKLRSKMGDAGSHPAVQTAIQFISSRDLDSKTSTTPVPDLPKISSFLTDSLTSTSTTTIFTTYDLFRLLLCDPRVSGYFAAEPSLKTTLALFTHVAKLQTPTMSNSASSTESCPYNLRLCALHAACNLFTAPLFTTTLHAASQASQDLVASLLTLITAALLDDSHPPLRVSAASLAYNLATAEHQARIAAITAENNPDTIASAHPPTPSPAQQLLTDAQQVELAAPLLEALSVAAPTDAAAPDQNARADAEAAHLQALAVARLAYLAPVDGELLDFCRALGARDVLLRQAQCMGGLAGGVGREAAEAQGVLVEIGEVLFQGM